MAFENKDLSVLVYAHGFTFWHYKTEDVGIGEGYFNDGAGLLRVGDIIVINYDDGESVTCLVAVKTNDNGVVGVKKMAVAK